MNTSHKLFNICQRHILKDQTLTRVPEPYIPFVPKNWNGTLVLAEAQNLSINGKYFQWLSSLTTDERIYHLAANDQVGIQPWDDGSLKLAVESALGIQADKTAVSNGVLWSLVDGKGNNKNPTTELMRHSQAVWAEMFALWKPEHIVTAGAVAARVLAGVFKNLNYKPRFTVWPLPSPRVLSPISKTVNEERLLRRFPEVTKAINANPTWVDGINRKNKILFSCLAVAAATGTRNE